MRQPNRLVAIFGAESIRWALLSVVAADALLATVHYALAARTLRVDLRATG